MCPFSSDNKPEILSVVHPNMNIFEFRDPVIIVSPHEIMRSQQVFVSLLFQQMSLFSITAVDSAIFDC